MVSVGMWILFLALLLYLGGMYWSFPLLVLFWTMALLVLLGTVQVFFSLRRLEISVHLEEGMAGKGEPVKGWAVVKNRFIFPLPACGLWICYGMQGGKETVKKLKCRLSSFGSCRMEFEIVPQWCGRLTVGTKKVTCSDMLGMIKAGRKLKRSVQLLVLPQDRELTVEIRRKDLLWYPGTGEVPEAVPGTEQSDYQLREYQEGDHWKNIHFKLMAKSGQMWTKVYQMESTEAAVLYVDLSGSRMLSPEERDGFWEALYSFAGGILREGRQFTAYWYDVKRETIDFQNVENDRDRLELMGRMIDMPVQEENLRTDWWKVLKEAFPGLPSGILCLDTKGQVWINEKPQFHLLDERGRRWIL